MPSDRIAIRVPSRTIRPLPIVERYPELRHVDADALAARIAERDRARHRWAAAVATMCTSSASSAAAITTMFGQAAQIGDVEGAGMGRPVRADQSGPVEGETDRQVLDRDIVHDLIVGALQEGRIDGAERLVAFRRQAGRERHRVLLGDADVEGAGRELLAEEVDAGARGHRGRDRDDLVVPRALP